jgi:hypothetical protein
MDHSLTCLDAEVRAAITVARVVAAHRLRSPEEQAQIDAYMESDDFRQRAREVEALTKPRLTLRYARPLSYDEVAAALGVPMDMAVLWLASLRLHDPGGHEMPRTWPGVLLSKMCSMSSAATRTGGSRMVIARSGASAQHVIGDAAAAGRRS